MEEMEAIAMDCGSHYIRTGYAGEDAPRSQFQTLIGRPHAAGSRTDRFIGDDAQRRRDTLALKFPMERGIVTDWAAMEQVWDYAFHDLRITTSEHPIILSEPALNPKVQRERTMEVMFETFHVPATFVSVQGIMVMYSSGRCSGLAVESGDGVTHIVPVYEGYSHRQAISRLDVGGQDVTNKLMDMLNQRGATISTTSQRETIRVGKESLAYVAMDPEAERTKDDAEIAKPFLLPDGREILVGKERFECCEALFSDPRGNVESNGDYKFSSKHVTTIPDLIHSALMRCDIDVRRDFQSNIVVSGGNTFIPMFVERLRDEMVKRSPSSARVRVIAPPERKLSVWIGQSIIASLSTFQPLWATAHDYAEIGPAVAHRHGTL